MRAWKQNAAGARTYFLYDGDKPVCELDSAGNVTATNTWGADGLVGRQANGVSVFYLFDPQGSPIVTLDGTGANQVSTAAFDAWGNRTTTDTSGDPYRGFGSQYGYYTDNETGLELLGHRYYDSRTGRFVTRDPIGIAGGFNVYAYVGNGPAGGMDPSGLAQFVIGVGAIGFFPFKALLNPIGTIRGSGGLNLWQRFGALGGSADAELIISQPRPSEGSWLNPFRWHIGIGWHAGGGIGAGGGATVGPFVGYAPGFVGTGRDNGWSWGGVLGPLGCQKTEDEHNVPNGGSASFRFPAFGVAVGGYRGPYWGGTIDLGPAWQVARDFVSM